MNKIIEEDIVNIIQSNIEWSSFKKKTVLVTGANGFLPAYMVEVLMYLNVHDKYDITVVCLVRNLVKAQSKFVNYLDNPHLLFLHQDVCDEIKYDNKIDFIIHAASQASPKYYGIDPVGTLSANIFGTRNVLNVAVVNKVESLLYFSSGEIYGIQSDESVPIEEDSYGFVNPMNIRSCYAESKRMGENMCVSWSSQYGVNVKIVRPFHTYGHGMDFTDGRVFADFVGNIVNSEDIIMKSDGLAQRPFCYLSDAIIAYFKILLIGESGEAYNVGNPNCECSILELAQTLVTLFPEKNLKVITQITANDLTTVQMKSPLQRSVPNIKKTSDLGWCPIVSVEQGFKRTIESYW